MKKNSLFFRPLALLAKIYAKDPGTLTKAQRLLETSVEASPHYLHAAFELMKIYDQQKQYDKVKLFWLF